MMKMTSFPKEFVFAVVLGIISFLSFAANHDPNHLDQPSKGIADEPGKGHHSINGHEVNRGFWGLWSDFNVFFKQGSVTDERSTFKPRAPEKSGSHRRRPVAEVIRRMRAAVEISMAGVEAPLERILLSYLGRFVDEDDDDSNKTTAASPLVLRLCGSPGTGKSTIACLLAYSVYSDLDPETMIRRCALMSTGAVGGESLTEPYLVTHRFSKQGSPVAEMLSVIRDVNKKLESLPYAKDGIAIILSRYNLAGGNVWTVMSSFINQENMRNSLVIVTDDLAPDASQVSPVSVRITPGTPADEALDEIVDEIKQAFPGDYVDILKPSSDNSKGRDAWIPFLPLHQETVLRLIEKVCADANEFIKAEVPDYHGKRDVWTLEAKL